MHFKLKKLYIRNFLGFGNKIEEIDLENPGTMMVIGVNVDRGGANGCGKTTIANAISYALYNKPLDPIGKEKLINTTNASKKTVMEVILDFSVGETEYRIKRGRGADYDTKLYINGEDKTPDSIANVDKAIADIVGISYELFRRTIVFRGSDTPFFEMPLSQQRGLIEELFRILTLSEKAELLKKQNQQLEKDIEVLEAQVKLQEKARDLRVKHIADAEARILKWEETKVATTERLKKSIEAASNVDYADQEEILKALEELEPKLKAVTENSREINADILRIDSKNKKIEGELSHLEDQKCPYCLQKFEGGDVKILELKTELVENEAKLELLHIEKAEYVDQMNILKIDVDGLKAQAKYGTMKQLLAEKQNIATYELQLKNNEASTNPHLEAYETLLAEQEVVIDYSRLDNMKSDLEHQKFLLKLLIDKNSFIRKKIINKSVPFLNKRIHHHCVKLGLPHMVSFNPDMTCTIAQFGRELDYGNLSGGEKKRLNLALSRAFRDVLHHLHTTVNMLFVDEVDGGSMDDRGIEAIIRSLKEMAVEEKDLAVWIVSHHPACNGRFDREMVVKFENGFSNIDTITLL